MDIGDLRLGLEDRGHLGNQVLLELRHIFGVKDALLKDSSQRFPVVALETLIELPKGEHVLGKSEALNLLIDLKSYLNVFERVALTQLIEAPLLVLPLFGLISWHQFEWFHLRREVGMNIFGGAYEYRSLLDLMRLHLRPLLMLHHDTLGELFPTLPGIHLLTD